MVPVITDEQGSVVAGVLHEAFMRGPSSHRMHFLKALLASVSIIGHQTYSSALTEYMKQDWDMYALVSTPIMEEAPEWDHGGGA